MEHETLVHVISYNLVQSNVLILNKFVNLVIELSILLFNASEIKLSSLLFLPELFDFTLRLGVLGAQALVFLKSFLKVNIGLVSDFLPIEADAEFVCPC